MFRDCSRLGERRGGGYSFVAARRVGFTDGVDPVASMSMISDGLPVRAGLLGLVEIPVRWI
ncbi:hypothetical protein [Halocatena pleomorpha]|uniref:Uncharacterized protein n=1 Tax=Halocatena pleomorpha TaxID=1785090 RepID=A0A3P3RAI6_9EURY|nr:hypothetical protein [Halocatena pleomorpha]RRJ30385.1 hypothetical protein EIK79_10735 [Halocatena pleomorpha]